METTKKTEYVRGSYHDLNTPSKRTTTGVLSRWVKKYGPESNQRTPFSKLNAERQIAKNQQSQLRSFAGANFGRTTSDWIANSTSQDSELYSSLRTLRNRSRQLARDNEYAANVVSRIFPNNVVGQGIHMQPQVMMQRGGKLNVAANEQILSAWKRWCRAENCHVAGTISFHDLERLAMRSVAESGEILIRLVTQKFGNSKIPLGLEIIEADQLVDNWSGKANNGNQIRFGVEVDKWQRPVAYWLYPNHPGDYAFASTAPSNEWTRVPADEIIHLYTKDRPLQTRGIPWLHSVLVTLRHIGGYEESVIVKARSAACIMGFIESPEGDNPLMPGADEMQSSGVMGNERVYDMEPGIIKELEVGEKFTGFSPPSTDNAIDPFLSYMLRSVAVGAGVSYATFTGDYSKSNFSSARMGWVDERENWRILQKWMIRSFHQPIFEAWLKMAVLCGELSLPGYEVNPEAFTDVRWMPRGWSFIDPLKDVTAAKLAVRAGFSSNSAVISQTGEHPEDVFAQIRKDRDMAADYNLVIETDPAQTDDKGIVQQMSAIAETNTGLDANGNPLEGGKEPVQTDATAGGGDGTPESQSKEGGNATS